MLLCVIFPSYGYLMCFRPQSTTVLIRTCNTEILAPTPFSTEKNQDRQKKQLTLELRQRRYKIKLEYPFILAGKC